MRPVADKLYFEAFPGLTRIERIEREEQKVLDIEHAIDVILHFENGMILTGQEKFLSYKYRRFNSLTVEYENDPILHIKGDWFHCAAQWYFCGYINEDETGFEPWVIVWWPQIVMGTLRGQIHWRHNWNKEDGASASFRYVTMTQLPEWTLYDYSWRKQAEPIQTMLFVK